MNLKLCMFTVSFVFQGFLNFCKKLFGCITPTNTHFKNDDKFNYFFISSLYRKYSNNHTLSVLNFVTLSTVIYKVFNDVRCGWVNFLVIILFKITRTCHFSSFAAHATIRNSDVLYLDRFSNDTNSKIIRRLSGVYSYVASLSLTNRSDWNIRFSPTTVVKYVNNTATDIFNVLYLRKTKVFNKGRYSRNRQFYRTGVYWCLYINIIAVIGMYFWFYRFVMNFGYVWWLFYISLASFVVAKTFHFRLYSPHILLNSIFKDIMWFGGVVGGIFESCIGCVFSGFGDNSYKGFTAGSFFDFRGYLRVFFKNIFASSSVYYVFEWFYSSNNYYINSLTTNPAKIFLSAGKNSYFSQIRDMLIK